MSHGAKGRIVPNMMVSRFFVPGLAALAALALTAALTRGSSYGGLAAGLLLLLLPIAVMVFRRARLPAHSPPVVLAVSYVAFGVMGFLFYPRSITDTGAVTARIILTEQQYVETLLLFAAAAALIIAGAAAFSATVTRAPVSPVVAAAEAGNPPARPIPASLPTAGVVAVLAVPAVLIVLGVGPEQVLQRDTYLTSGSSLSGPQRAFFSLGKTLAVGAVVLAAYASAVHKGARSAAFLIFGVGTYASLLFALGTRQLAALPVLVLAGRVVAGRLPRRPGLTIPAIVIATFLLVQIPLALRSLPTHGFAPYLAYVMTSPGDLVSAERFFASVQNILFGFPLTGYVAMDVRELSMDELLVSVNPLPGSLTNWYEVYEALRVNVYTPYCAVGEIANHGVVAFSLYFLVVGAFFAHTHAYAMTLPARFRSPAQLGFVGLSVLFAVTSLQYNLRSSTRLLYYALALELVVLGVNLYRKSVAGTLSAAKAPPSRPAGDRGSRFSDTPQVGQNSSP